MDHLRALRVINFVYGAVLALGALALLVAVSLGAEWWMMRAPQLQAESTRGPLIFMSGAIALMSAIVFLAGSLVGRARGRVLQTVLAAFNLFEFPVGTLYGMYALWVCWFNDRTREAFRTHTPLPPPTPL